MRRLLALLFLLLLAPEVGHAEGPLSGGTRIYLEDEPIGAFLVTSFAAPNPPVTTDNLWITVQIRDGARAVDNARVLVTVQPEGGGEAQRSEATHELAAQPFDYTAALPVPESGLYNVVIEVEHPDGSGTVTYPVRVSRPLTNVIFLVVGLPFLIAGIWLVRRVVGRTPGAARGEQEEEEVLTREALHE